MAEHRLCSGYGQDGRGCEDPARSRPGAESGMRLHGMKKLNLVFEEGEYGC